MLGRLLVIGSAFVIKADGFSAMTPGGPAFAGDVAPPEPDLMGLSARGTEAVFDPPIIGGLKTASSCRFHWVSAAY